MNSPLPSILPLPDMLALGWFFLCWIGYAYYADQRRWGTRELASVLHAYRLERENLIADTVVLQAVNCPDSVVRLWRDCRRYLPAQRNPKYAERRRRRPRGYRFA